MNTQIYVYFLYDNHLYLVVVNKDVISLVSSQSAKYLALNGGLHRHRRIGRNRRRHIASRYLPCNKYIAGMYL